MHEAHLLAQQASDGLAELAPWASLGGNAVIAAILVYLITKRGPEERREARADMAEERKAREESQAKFQQALDAERISREQMTLQFMQQLTENREKSHSQRMEDRKVYMDATQALLREFMATAKELAHGDRKT